MWVHACIKLVCVSSCGSAPVSSFFSQIHRRVAYQYIKKKGEEIPVLQN